jgi:hypothetical protein
MLLIPVHAGFQQGGMPVTFPGPFLLHQAMMRQMRQCHSHPQRPLGNVAAKQSRLKAMKAQRGPIPTKCGPRSEPGAVGGRLRGSRRQRGPQLGPATSLRPGSPNKLLMVNPRRRDAERRGSRPRVRRAFTTNPCRDQVSSRVGRWMPWTGRRLGSRGELMRKRCTVSTARCSNNKRKQQSFSRYPANSSLGIGCSSRPRRPTSRVGRSRQSSAASARTRSSKTLSSLNATARHRRRTR